MQYCEERRAGAHDTGGETSLPRRACLNVAEVQKLAAALRGACETQGVRRLSVTGISRKYGVSQIDALRIFARMACLGGQRDIVFVDDGEYRPPTSRPSGTASSRNLLSRREWEFLTEMFRQELPGEG